MAELYMLNKNLRENYRSSLIYIVPTPLNNLKVECTEYLQQLFGLKYNHLNKEEQIILGTAYLENGVTNVRMQSILDLHSTDIGRILSSLVEENMLLADRKGRWTSYRINLNYEMLPEQYQMSDMQQTEIEF